MQNGRNDRSRTPPRRADAVYTRAWRPGDPLQPEVAEHVLGRCTRIHVTQAYFRSVHRFDLLLNGNAIVCRCLRLSMQGNAPVKVLQCHLCGPRSGVTTLSHANEQVAVPARWSLVSLSMDFRRFKILQNYSKEDNIVVTSHTNFLMDIDPHLGDNAGTLNSWRPGLITGIDGDDGPVELLVVSDSEWTQLCRMVRE
eukprot:TRINITY_DN51706_c0_g1_i1.p1 TRINITY_DN51706_c0_g1~~TRINITY_DN51706_c0_g1_i1.p1  ORF type:complete len:197 (-),score=23.95 TRINITY_DN51706_c0_g1_i1:50-640(-)